MDKQLWKSDLWQELSCEARPKKDEEVMTKNALKILEQRAKNNPELMAEYLKEKEKLRLEKERVNFLIGEACYLSIQFSRKMQSDE